MLLRWTFDLELNEATNGQDGSSDVSDNNNKVDIEDSSLRLQYGRYDTVLLIKEYWKISTVTTEWEKSLRSKDCDVG